MDSLEKCLFPAADRRRAFRSTRIEHLVVVGARLRNGRIGFNRLTSRWNVCRYERFEWGRCTFRNASSDCRDGNNSRNMAHKLCCAAQYYSARVSTRINLRGLRIDSRRPRSATFRTNPTRRHDLLLFEKVHTDIEFC